MKLRSSLTIAVAATLNLPLLAQQPQQLQPVSVGIVSDVSGPMAGKLHRAR